MEKRQPFHQQLRRERVRRGWSQEYVASKVGSDVKTVGRWESGERLPRPYYRQQLFALFDKDAESFGLFEYTNKDESSYSPAVREDWGEAPDVMHFYGREQERAVLQQWIEGDHCRVVAVLGMGGVGKTTLAAKLAQQMKEAFTYIFWRSLQNAPSLEHILKQSVHYVSNQQNTNLPEELDDQISLLLRYLRDHRCLLILDNVESILQSGQHAGQYEKGFKGYGRLIQRLGEAQHQSCLLLTSREKPEEVAHLEGKASPVRSLPLSGVGQSEGREILHDKGLFGSDEQWSALVQLYSGNPLALKLVAEPIQAVFGGEIARFLREEKTAIGDISALLEQQFHRLSAQEQEILCWLAIEREAVSLEDLRENLVHPLTKEVLLEGLASLRRRSMIETRGSVTFTLQPVIMEYVTTHFVKRACNEFGAGSVGVWVDYALIKAQAKDYVRDIQVRFILTPIADRLLDAFGQQGIEQGLKDMLAAQRQIHPQQRGYAAGNALNLLIHLNSDLRGTDFSHLVIWQAYLQNVPLPDVSFSHAHFVASTFTNTFGNVLSVAISPRGDRLVAGTADGDIWIYQARTGTPLQTCHGHSDGVWSVAFSHDGHLLASSSDDQTICLWDIGDQGTSYCLNTLRDHTNRVRSIAFGPGGRLLASGSDDQTIRLWDIEDQSSIHCLKTLRGHTDRVWAVAFSADGSLLASGSTDQTVRLWNVSTGDCLKTLQGHTDWVRSVTLSSDGRTLASGSDDQTVRVWDIDTGQELKVLRGHTNRVWSVTFNSDGSLLASSSEDQSIRLWDANTGRCLKTLQGHTHGVRSVALSSRAAMLASGGDDQTVRVWDIDTGYCLKTLQGYTNRVWSVAFSANGSVLASSNEDQAIRVWDIDTGFCVKTFQDRIHGVRAIAFSPDGHTLASGGEDQTVRLWDVSSDDCLKILRGHTNWVRAVAFNPDGSTIASGSEDHAIRLWSVDTGECLNTLQGHTSWIRSVNFNPSGLLLASSSDDQTIRIWEAATGLCLHKLQGHTGRVRSVVFSPDGRLLASGSEDKTIRIWDVGTGHCLSILQGHTSWVHSVVFSPDGYLLASSGDDQTIRIWENASQGTKECLKMLQGHTNRIRWVTFSPNGHTLASCSDDGTIKLWELQTSTCLKTFISERPYEHMDITDVQGLTSAQKTALHALGAVEENQ